MVLSKEAASAGMLGQLDYEQGRWVRTQKVEGWERLVLCYESICPKGTCEVDFVHSPTWEDKGVGRLCPLCKTIMVEEALHWHLKALA